MSSKHCTTIATTLSLLFIQQKCHLPVSQMKKQRFKVSFDDQPLSCPRKK